MFALFVRFELKPGREDAFDELTARTVTNVIEHELDTLMYVSRTVEGAPRSRVFYELYRSRQAKEIHDGMRHVRDFMAAREEHLEGIRVEFLDTLPPFLARKGAYWVAGAGVGE